MEKQNPGSVWERIKKACAELFNKLDKKIEEKSKAKPCCCKPRQGKDKPCCS